MYCSLHLMRSVWMKNVVYNRFRTSLKNQIVDYCGKPVKYETDRWQRLKD